MVTCVSDSKSQKEARINEDAPSTRDQQNNFIRTESDVIVDFLDIVAGPCKKLSEQSSISDKKLTCFLQFCGSLVDFRVQLFGHTIWLSGFLKTRKEPVRNLQLQQWFFCFYF